MLPASAVIQDLARLEYLTSDIEKVLKSCTALDKGICFTKFKSSQQFLKEDMLRWSSSRSQQDKSPE